MKRVIAICGWLIRQAIPNADHHRTVLLPIAPIVFVASKVEDHLLPLGELAVSNPPVDRDVREVFEGFLRDAARHMAIIIGRVEVEDHRAGLIPARPHLELNSGSCSHD